MPQSSTSAIARSREAIRNFVGRCAAHVRRRNARSRNHQEGERVAQVEVTLPPTAIQDLFHLFLQSNGELLA